MIQDIAPSRLNNSWQPKQPAPGSIVMCFREGKLLASTADGELHFPRYQNEANAVYLFSVDDEDFFLADIAEIPAGYQFYTMRELRDQCAGKNLYAAFTAYHLNLWYTENRYCGICRGIMQHDTAERALVCTDCGHKVYPRINPAVIVGVVSAGRLLITLSPRLCA